MTKNKKIIVILFSVLGVLLLVYFFVNTRAEKRYSWRENYRSDNNQPYGTLFIRQLLESYRPGETFLLNDEKPLHILLDSVANAGSADYVFIGHTLNLDDADSRALLDFIYTGHDAFIASVDMPFNVVDSVFVYECDREIFLEEHQLSAATLNFYHKNLHVANGYPYRYRNNAGDQRYYWNSINEEVFCDSLKSTIPLGYHVPDRVNFVKLPYGDGNLFVHCNPIVFTNYFMAERDKAEYAASVFSHLGGKSIIWDEFSKAPFAQNNAPNVNPLAYILSHGSLKYAWWMMLAAVILYAIFAARRKQRVIPVLEQKTNTSLEFVKMISALHFQNGNHGDIARKKMKYFLYFIRAKYGIHAQHFTDDHMKRLAEKSNVDIEHIRDIFSRYHQIDYSMFNASDDRLVNLYQAINKFYKHCK